MAVRGACPPSDTALRDSTCLPGAHAPLATYLMCTRSQAGSLFCTPSGSSGGQASNFSLRGHSGGAGSSMAHLGVRKCPAHAPCTWTRRGGQWLALQYSVAQLTCGTAAGRMRPAALGSEPRGTAAWSCRCAPGRSAAGSGRRGGLERAQPPPAGQPGRGALPHSPGSRQCACRRLPGARAHAPGAGLKKATGRRSRERQRRAWPRPVRRLAAVPTRSQRTRPRADTACSAPAQPAQVWELAARPPPALRQRIPISAWPRNAIIKFDRTRQSCCCMETKPSCRALLLSPRPPQWTTGYSTRAIGSSPDHQLPVPAGKDSSAVVARFRALCRRLRDQALRW